MEDLVLAAREAVRAAQSDIAVDYRMMGRAPPTLGGADLPREGYLPNGDDPVALHLDRPASAAAGQARGVLAGDGSQWPARGELPGGVAVGGARVPPHLAVARLPRQPCRVVAFGGR